MAERDWHCPECGTLTRVGRCAKCGYVNKLRWTCGEEMTFTISTELLIAIGERIGEKLIMSCKGNEVITKNFYLKYFTEWKKEYKKIGSPILCSQVCNTMEKNCLADHEALALLGAYGERMKSKAERGEISGMVARYRHGDKKGRGDIFRGEGADLWNRYGNSLR